MRDGWIFLKISTPPSKINVKQMNLISAGSFLLDSTFQSGQQRTPYGAVYCSKTTFIWLEIELSLAKFMKAHNPLSKNPIAFYEI